MQQYMLRATKTEVKTWISSNLRNYLIKNDENVGEIEHIIDYLESDKAPKRLMKMSYEEAVQGAKKWVNAMVKKGFGIKETDDDTEVILRLNNGFTLRKLITKTAYEREGSLMSHCVSSYSDKKCEIYSLRDCENMPHCTIERNGENFDQIKGKGNGEIHPRYIQYIIEILNYFGFDVRSSEMENLGYSKISVELLDLGAIYYTNFGKYVLEMGDDFYFYKNAHKSGLKENTNV